MPLIFNPSKMNAARMLCSGVIHRALANVRQVQLEDIKGLAMENLFIRKRIHLPLRYSLHCWVVYRLPGNRLPCTPATANQGSVASVSARGSVCADPKPGDKNTRQQTSKAGIPARRFPRRNAGKLRGSLGNGQYFDFIEVRYDFSIGLFEFTYCH